MTHVINNVLIGLNSIGRVFCDYAAGMFVQSALLVILLLVVDLLLRKRVRAVFRYCVWLLVLVKLVLPPTLSLPTGIGYWVGDRLPAAASISDRAFDVAGLEHTGPSGEMPQVRPAEDITENDALITPADSAPTPLTWQAILFILWFVGVFAFLVVLIQRVKFVRGLIAVSSPAKEELLGLLEQCRRQIGVRRDIKLRISDTIPSPAVCGFFSPTVLIPTPLVEKLSPEGLRATLIHELAHIKRGDLWVNSVQTFLQIIYFYNPFVWFANAVIRRVCEEAVDEMVLVTLGGQAKDYSNTLIDIGEMAFWRADLGLRLIGVAESKKALQWRIKHMLNRPIPKNAKVGLWGLLAIVIAGTVLLPMAGAGSTDDDSPNNGGYGILLLENSDTESKGKNQYDDRLYLLDSGGKVEGAVSGFEISETMGGSHVLAVDEKRKTLWVAENVGGRLWHFDLKTGMLLQRIPDLKASAVAIDAATGNAWIVVYGGAIDKGHIQVVSPSGQKIAQHKVPGFDIAYSHYDDSFWIVGKNIYKVDTRGKILGQIVDQIPSRAASVSVDQKTGNAWVVVRAHPQIVDSKPEVWIVGEDVQIQKRMNLGDLIPFCVAVDSDNGIVWVGCLGTTLHFTTAGEKLKSARLVAGFSVIPGASPNSVIAASKFGLIMASVRDMGYVEMGPPPDEVREQFSWGQKWVAMVPFAGAKLQSSAELAYLMDYKILEKQLTKHPNSVAKLKALGKAVLMFSNDYEEKYPDALQGVREFVEDDVLTWCEENVTYLGKGMTTADPPNIVVAYDKTLLEKGDGTLVLYNDSNVAFESSRQLEKLGIKPVSIENLKQLALAARMYADDHDGNYAENVEKLREYLRDEKLINWALEDVEYLGKGAKLTDAATATRPMAYFKPLLATTDGTTVAFFDGHVEFVKGRRLDELGVKPKP